MAIRPRTITSSQGTPDPGKGSDLETHSRLDRVEVHDRTGFAFGAIQHYLSRATIARFFPAHGLHAGCESRPLARGPSARAVVQVLAHGSSPRRLQNHSTDARLRCSRPTSVGVRQWIAGNHRDDTTRAFFVYGPSGSSHSDRGEWSEDRENGPCLHATEVTSARFPTMVPRPLRTARHPVVV
jgi:hypothetical protein